MGLAIEVFNLGGHPTVKRSDGTHLSRVEGRAEQKLCRQRKKRFLLFIVPSLSLIFFDFDPELDEPEEVGTKKWS